MPIILRRFKQEGDTQRANELILASDGLSRTRLLAEEHHAQAVKYVQQLPGVEYRGQLEGLADKVLNRSS